jgi:hypothetical protein
MFKVYVSHSKDFDFKNELYKVLRESSLNPKYQFFLPHENSDELASSKEFFKNECDVLVVEASYPKIGVGIEVGWADAFDVPLIVLIRKDFKLSASLKFIAKEIITYSSNEEMLLNLEKSLENIKK